MKAAVFARLGASATVTALILGGINYLANPSTEAQGDYASWQRSRAVHVASRQTTGWPQTAVVVAKQSPADTAAAHAQPVIVAAR